MFQSIRQNSPVYLLYKSDNPRLEIGYATSQVVPRAKYAVPPTFGTPQEMVVDLTVKVNGKTVNCNSLPASMDIADTVWEGESLVVSDNKEAMNAEILTLKQKSRDVLESVEFHKNLMTNCDKILADLNPEFAEKQHQREEIDGLKAQLASMTTSIEALLESNKRLMEKIKEG